MSGRPGSASIAAPLGRGTTGSARGKTSAAVSGSIAATGTESPSRLAARSTKSGSATRKKGGSIGCATRIRQAASASSGPMPAGSPSVSASGGIAGSVMPASPGLLPSPRPAQRTAEMPSAVETVPTFWRRSASPRVFSSTRRSTVWLRSRTPMAVAIGETM